MIVITGANGKLGRAITERLLERVPADQVGMFLASRRGEFSAVDPTLTQVLGRRSTSVRDVLRDALTPASVEQR